jgi:hypothetical protein
MVVKWKTLKKEGDKFSDDDEAEVDCFGPEGNIARIFSLEYDNIAKSLPEFHRLK